MAYIGNVPAEAYTNTVKDSFNGTGSATAFTLSQPTLTNDVRVVVENVVQDPAVAYNVSGVTLTFTSAPPSGTGNIYVVHLGPAVMTTVPPAEIAGATTFASSVSVQGAFTSLGIDDNATSTAITIDASENVGIGTSSPSAQLHQRNNTSGINAIVENASNNTRLQILSTGLNKNSELWFGDGADDDVGRIDYDHNNNSMSLYTNSAERLRIDSSGNVGIGNVAPDETLEVSGDIKASGSGFGIYHFGDTSDVTKIVGRDASHASLPNTMEFHTNSAEAIRIDASGNVLLGKTTADNTTEGFTFYGTHDGVSIVKAEGAPLILNRLTNDGGIAVFRKNGSTVGSIGIRSGVTSYIVLDPRSGGTGISGGTRQILPTNTSGVAVDNTADLGASSVRWDDVYATNGTIQTSDRNEKQDIEVLTAAETAVAVACKGLLRKFRWIDSVTEKGDDARIHFGIIAQDLQDAFTAEGLDAGRYAMFISSTWWETQTDVPAVVAVDEVLDEDGGVVTEAVDAVDAYTRTDTFDEVTKGATERTRLGVRYPELLAFIIGAL